MMDKVVGIVEPLVKELENEKVPSRLLEIAAEREKARKSNDFAKADQLRDLVGREGYAIEDTPDGSRVYKL